jgi:kanamycin kinase
MGRRITKAAMKKTLIERIPMWLPDKIGRLCEGAKIYDSSSSPEAKVYFIDRDGGYYIKVGASGSLKREAVMTEYFHKKGLGTEILNYFSGEDDILVSCAMQGEDCTTAKYLDDSKRLAKLMGEMLRELHEIECTDCPVTDRVGEMIAVAEKNYRTDNYSKEHFPDSFGYSSGEEAYRVLNEGKHLLKNECLIHGDFCLPNIMLKSWRLSGFIDLGGGGIGDRHMDLFWGWWTIGFNLALRGEERNNSFGEYFLDCYGRDKIDKAALDTVAAAAVFG